MITFNFQQTPITQIADAIIIDASRKGSSDIHFDPRDNGLMVRIRIDGELTDYAHIPEAYERNLITRLKLMSGMNITESRLPQDGAIKGNFGGKDLDMRCSSLPTNEGEKIVIRILDYSRSLEGISSLGFSKKNYDKLSRMIANPNGIILVTGATGTGKSTTVYSMLQVLNKEQTNIITVEDPIEMNIEGLNQVQVNSEIGLTFATVLRSILRQDPNVILIGEIRDSETAKIAVRAAITGHLVLSTIHTNNSLSTIERLLDMDVEKYLLSSAISGIISQRLAKQLCPKCRIKREPTPYEKKVFKLALGKDITEIYDANHDGCSECNHGYRGRIAIQEVLEINDSIRNAINEITTDKNELQKLVYGQGNVTTLLQDGLEKILEGQTSFEEIYRIIEIDNDIDDSYIQMMDKAITEKENNELTALQEEKEKVVEKIKEDTKTEVSKNVSTVVEAKNVAKSNITEEKISTSPASSILNKEKLNKAVNESNPKIINEVKEEIKVDEKPVVSEEKKEIKAETKEDLKKYSKDFYPKELDDTKVEVKTENKPEVKEDLKQYSKDFYPKELDEKQVKEEIKTTQDLINEVLHKNKEEVKPEVKEDLKKYSKDFYPKELNDNKVEVKEDLKQYSKDFYPKELETK